MFLFRFVLYFLKVISNSLFSMVFVCLFLFLLCFALFLFCVVFSWKEGHNFCAQEQETR